MERQDYSSMDCTAVATYGSSTGREMAPRRQLSGDPAATRPARVAPSRARGRGVLGKELGAVAGVQRHAETHRHGKRVVQMQAEEARISCGLDVSTGDMNKG